MKRHIVYPYFLSLCNITKKCVYDEGSKKIGRVWKNARFCCEAKELGEYQYPRQVKIDKGECKESAFSNFPKAFNFYRKLLLEIYNLKIVIKFESNAISASFNFTFSYTQRKNLSFISSFHNSSENGIIKINYWHYCRSTAYSFHEQEKCIKVKKRKLSDYSIRKKVA